MRQQHLLLKMLDMRILVDDNRIFQLDEKEPVMISFTEEVVSFFISNGFHTSKKMSLPYQPGSTYFFQVNAAIDNTGIITAAGISLLLFVFYILYGLKLLLLLANIPVLTLIIMFFILRRNSIRVSNWTPA